MKTEMIALRVTEVDKEALKKLCEKKDIPMSQLMREILRDYLKANQ